MYSGINISGVNAEVMPAQWEYQVGGARGRGACGGRRQAARVRPAGLGCPASPLATRLPLQAPVICRLHLPSMPRPPTPAPPLPPSGRPQVGPCTGIAMGDDLWMSRYIMYRLAELYNVEVRWAARG